MIKYISKKQLLKKQQVENKQLLVKLKLSIGAGSAAMTPPLGPILGQYGINIMEFCNDFNQETLQFERGNILKVYLYINIIKAFYFEIELLKISYMLKELFKNEFIKTGNTKIYIEKDILLKKCYDVAIYICAFNNIQLRSSHEINQQFLKVKIFELLGNCKSMGIFIKE